MVMNSCVVVHFNRLAVRSQAIKISNLSDIHYQEAPEIWSWYFSFGGRWTWEENGEESAFLPPSQTSPVLIIGCPKCPVGPRKAGRTKLRTLGIWTNESPASPEILPLTGIKSAPECLLWKLEILSWEFCDDSTFRPFCQKTICIWTERKALPTPDH